MVPKAGFTLASFLLAAALSLPLPGCSKQDRHPPAARRQAERSEEPRYAGYRFGQEGVLDFGVQPLAMPQCSVSELISRDRLLGARLQSGSYRLQSFPFFTGPDVYRYLAEGQLEAGLLGDMPAIMAAARGEVVVVAMVKQGFCSIVAAKPMLVKELKGKRIATGFGSTAHFALLNALEGEGLNECDVTLVDMEVGFMPQALAEGKIDAFSAWEPTPTLAFAGHPEFQLVHKGLTFAFLCLRRDFLAAHPEQARELAAAVARASLWMRRPGNLEQLAVWTRASAARFQEEAYSLTAAQMMDITRRDLLNVPIAPQIPERLLGEHELLGKEFEFLRKSGRIPWDSKWETIRQALDTDLLRGVMSERERYGLEKFDYLESKDAGGAK